MEQKKAKPTEINFTLLDLVFPFTIPLKGLFFIAERLKEAGEGEMTDESKVYEQLLELQMKFEMEEITDEEYEKRETELMQRLEVIRKYKEEF